VRQLLPPPEADPAIDPYLAYGDVAPPWLRLNLVVSLDGSTTDTQGWTDELGGDPDRRVFRTLRALCDGILIGASTVRTGRVGPHRPPEALRVQRLREGKPGSAAVVVVSQSLNLDWSLPLFAAAANPTVVVTSQAAIDSARLTPPLGVRVVVAGTSRVDLRAAVGQLGATLGIRHVLCEGGPTLATSLLIAGLVDELCLSVAPLLIGARHHTLLAGNLPGPVQLTPYRLYEEGGVLFARYRPASR
jgi:riboflavin-specific deaminase-like protein